MLNGNHRSENVSAPMGTTVKVKDFLKTVPVRHRAMSKEAAKQIAKLKRMLQSYALARPNVRLSFRVLQTKTSKDDWIYACKPGNNINTVKDAVVQIIGRECVGQCKWFTLCSDGYKVQALLPKLSSEDGNDKKLAIAGHGLFLCVNRRPLRANGKVAKSIIMVFREKMKLLHNSTTFEVICDPFMWVGITCPLGSYDSNVEPMKDDVIFYDKILVNNLIQKLFDVAYRDVATMFGTPDRDQLESNIAGVMNRKNTADGSRASYGQISDFGSNSVKDANVSVFQQIDKNRDDYTNIATSPTLGLNPWIVAKLHSGNKATKNHATANTLSYEEDNVHDVMNRGSASTRTNGNLKYGSYLPTPLPSSPLPQMQKPSHAHSAFQEHDLSYTPDSGSHRPRQLLTPRQKSKPKSLMQPQSSPLQNYSFPSKTCITKPVRNTNMNYGTFHDHQRLNLSLSKPFVSPARGGPKTDRGFPTPSSTRVPGSPIFRRQYAQNYVNGTKTCSSPLKMHGSSPLQQSQAAKNAFAEDLALCAINSNKNNAGSSERNNLHQSKLKLHWLKRSGQPRSNDLSTSCGEGLKIEPSSPWPPKTKQPFFKTNSSLGHISIESIGQALLLHEKSIAKENQATLMEPSNDLLGTLADFSSSKPWAGLTRCNISLLAAVVSEKLNIRSGILISQHKLKQSMVKAMLSS